MKKLRGGSTRGMGAGHHGPAPAADGGDAGAQEEGGGASGSRPADESREGPGVGSADADDGPDAAGDGPRTGGGDGAAGPWDVPVLKTVASEGKGVDAVLGAVDDHHRHLQAGGELERRRREQLLEQARAVLLRRLERRGREAWDARVGDHEEALAAGRITPYELADRVEATLGD